MATWTNKQWGALIAGLVVFLIALLGVGEAALVVIFAIIGYLPGACLDEFVGQWVLRVLEPAALELSLEASEYLEKEREELDGLWHKRLERVSYEADRAGRHYRLIEPENRLVARQLAREWEEKLEAQRKLQEDYRRFVREQPRPLSEAERKNIHRLARNIPALWHSPSTTMAERKEIVRQIVE